MGYFPITEISLGSFYSKVKMSAFDASVQRALVRENHFSSCGDYLKTRSNYSQASYILHVSIT
jgi:hypothetical protein